jgi:hypothetical protein
MSLAAYGSRPMKFAVRPVRAALAVKIAIAILGLNVSVAAAKVYLASSQPAPIVAESASSTTPFILHIDAPASSKASCREAIVDADEGYGVRGKVARVTCDE